MGIPVPFELHHVEESSAQSADLWLHKWLLLLQATKFCFVSFFGSGGGLHRKITGMAFPQKHYATTTPNHPKTVVICSHGSSSHLKQLHTMFAHFGDQSEGLHSLEQALLMGC